MTYPLAHDENGFPLIVPPTAAGWLVRRHGGGKGRPATIYDADGRPLIQPLEATAEDLRAAGCRPGPHRLDAVDDRRQPIGVVAYTELPGGEGADEGPAKSATDPAVMALARAVEAMQRVQAERERMQVERDRVQAEMFAKLIERLAPPPAQPAVELRNAIAQAIDVHKTLRDAMEEDDGDDDDAPRPPAAPGAWWTSPVFASAVEGFVKQMMPLIAAWAAGFARSSAATAPAAPLRNAPAPPQPGAHVAPAAAVSQGASAQAGPADGAARDAQAKRDAVFAKLTSAERAVIDALLVDPAARDEIDTVLARVSVPEGVAGLRELIACVKPPASSAPGNGASSSHQE